MVQQLGDLDRRPVGAPPDRVPWSAVVVFVIIAYALMWAATIPFWLSPRGLAMPGAQLILIAVMFAPALASLVACRLVERRPWARSVGLRAGPVRRVIGFAGLAVGLVALVLLVALLISGALGLQRLGLSGLRVAARDLPGPMSTLGPAAYLGLVLVNALIQIVTINAVSALGEETGWRGYLLSRLQPLGRARSIVITGVVWGLWHTPLILLGYEYPRANRAAALVAFVGFTVAVGALLAWLRLRSGSVIPGALGHGALNALGPLSFLLLAGGHPGRVLLGAPQGLVAIACFAALAVALLLARRTRIENPGTVGGADRARLSPARPPAPRP